MDKKVNLRTHSDNPLQPNLLPPISFWQNLVNSDLFRLKLTRGKTLSTVYVGEERELDLKTEKIGHKSSTS